MHCKVREGGYNSEIQDTKLHYLTGTQTQTKKSWMAPGEGTSPSFHYRVG